MCRLYETIKVEKRQLKHIVYHNARLNRARKEVFGNIAEINLEDFIQIPDDLSNEIFKCRVTYDRKIIKIEFEKHKHRVINSLKVIHCNEIDYHLKYSNREQLRDLYEKREDCDEVLIIKDGFVTDTSFSNIVFWNGSQWITPENPLLEGTARARLLDQKVILKGEIRIEELSKYPRARIINALNDLQESGDILEFVI